VIAIQFGVNDRATSILDYNNSIWHLAIYINRRQHPLAQHAGEYLQSYDVLANILCCCSLFVWLRCLCISCLEWMLSLSIVRWLHSTIISLLFALSSQYKKLWLTCFLPNRLKQLDQLPAHHHAWAPGNSACLERLGAASSPFYCG
jgi:hypothetical protein